MDYNTIRNAWGADAREVYSTPLDKLPMKKNLDKFRGCLIGGAAGDLAVFQRQGNGNVAAHALGSADEIAGHAACGGSGLAAAAVAQQTDTHNNRHGQRSHALADLILFHCFFLLIFGLLVFGHLSAKKGELLIRKAVPPR